MPAKCLTWSTPVSVRRQNSNVYAVQNNTKTINRNVSLKKIQKIQLGVCSII